jgi:hypothetical protein
MGSEGRYKGIGERCREEKTHLSGISIQQIMYARIPAPQTANIAQMTLTTVGSISRYSAIPAHTPAIILFLLR